MSDDDAWTSDEGIAESTFYVLGGIGALFVATFIFVLFRLLPSESKNSKKRSVRQDQHNVAENTVQISSAPTIETQKQAAQKPGVSLKQLVKQSNHAASRQPAADKPVEHPLYVAALKGFHTNVTGISFSPAGDVATVTEDQVLKVFSVQDLTAKTFPNYRTSLQRPAIDCAFASASEIYVLVEGPLATANLEKFTLQSGRFEQEWSVTQVHGKEAGRGLKAGVNQYHHSLAMSYSVETDLKVYNSKGKQLASINTSGLKNHGAALSTQARFLGAATFTSDVKLHEIQYTREGDFSRVQKVMDLKKAHSAQVYCLAFSPDGTKAVTASKDGSWAVWNINVRYTLDEDPKLLMKSNQPTGAGRYTQISFGPQGIIAAAYDCVLHFLDSARGTLLEEIEDAHDDSIAALEWSPIEHSTASLSTKTVVLVTSALDKRVRLWRAPII